MTSLTLRLPAILVGVCVASGLAGCGYFRSRAPAVTSSAPTPKEQHVRVSLRAIAAVNPSATGKPQPVKACIVVMSNPSWRPPHALEGLPCTGLPEGGEAALLWLAPGQVSVREFTIPDGKPLPLLVAAEFQHVAAGKDVLVIPDASAAGDDLHVSIVARGIELNSAPPLSKPD